MPQTLKMFNFKYLYVDSAVEWLGMACLFFVASCALLVLSVGSFLVMLGWIVHAIITLNPHDLNDSWSNVE